jgi:hypothetical protein
MVTAPGEYVTKSDHAQLDMRVCSTAQTLSRVCRIVCYLKQHMKTTQE